MHVNDSNLRNVNKVMQSMTYLKLRQRAFILVHSTIDLTIENILTKTQILVTTTLRLFFDGTKLRMERRSKYEMGLNSVSVLVVTYPLCKFQSQGVKVKR